MAADKGPPLSLFVVIADKRRCERHRRHLQGGLPLAKGLPDRQCQHRAIKTKVGRQGPDIEEILHPAVDLAQVNYSLELFSVTLFPSAPAGRRSALHPGRTLVREPLRPAAETFASSLFPLPHQDQDKRIWTDGVGIPLSRRAPPVEDLLPAPRERRFAAQEDKCDHQPQPGA